MNEFIFGFSTGLSLILAIGAQNLFVIEQGIKKNNIFFAGAWNGYGFHEDAVLSAVRVAEKLGCVL